MAKVKVPQRFLPFVTKELSRRLSADARRRAVDLLSQMLIGAVLVDRRAAETPHDREDPADAS